MCQKQIFFTKSSSSFEGHPLQVRHKQDWGQRFILLLPQIVALPELDAGLITPLPASDSSSAAVWGSKRINLWSQSCLCLTCSGCPSNNDDDNNDQTQPLERKY